MTLPISSFFTPRLRRKEWLGLLLCMASLAGLSQKSLLSQAEKLFQEKRYNEAIPLYDKVYEKKKDRQVLLKLADANYLNENYPRAQKYYAEYFRDTVYENIPQFSNYAHSSKASGKISLAVALYTKMYENSLDTTAKSMAAIYKLYVDSGALTRSYSLDSNYNCVLIDASESLDTLAAPMFYQWEFDDGSTAEGLKTEHCFDSEGDHRVVLNIVDKETGYVRHRDTLLLVQIEKLPVRFKAPGKGRRYFFLDFEAEPPLLPDHEVIDYLWEMDNGDICSGARIRYQYNNSRDYLVKLFVIARHSGSGQIQLFSANRLIEVLENYETPSKKFSDALNEAK